MQGDSMPGDHPDSWAAYFYMFRSWTQIIPFEDQIRTFEVSLQSYYEALNVFAAAILLFLKQSESWSLLWNCPIIG